MVRRSSKVNEIIERPKADNRLTGAVDRLCGRVEEKRGGVQDRRRQVRAASFVAALAEKSIAPFLLPAHRTGHADLPHLMLLTTSGRAFFVWRRGARPTGMRYAVVRRDGGQKTSWTEPLHRRSAMEIECPASY